MPLITAFNLRKEDRLPDIENALRRALVSMAELQINDDEIDFVPVLMPEGFHGQVTRINVDLWEGVIARRKRFKSWPREPPRPFNVSLDRIEKLPSSSAPTMSRVRGGCRFNQPRDRRARQAGGAVERVRVPSEKSSGASHLHSAD
jgi:hypothetical protein